MRAFLVASALLGPAVPAQAGLLDFLFGRPAPMPVYAPAPSYAPQPAYEPQVRRARAPRVSAAPSEEDSARQAARIASSLELSRRLSDLLRERGAQAAFQNDPTLRSGDIVVTQVGFQVFEGGKGEWHKASQFRPLRESSLRNRGDLEKMQRASRLAPAPVSRTASAEPPALTIQKSSERGGKPKAQ